MAAVWDARRTLDVDPHSPGFTCVGYAHTKGRRCHWDLDPEDRNDASDLLDRISATNPQQTEALEVSLGGLASKVLCKRWHQNQSNGVVGGWLRKVENLGPRSVSLDPPMPAWLSTFLSNNVPMEGSWTFTPTTAAASPSRATSRRSNAPPPPTLATRRRVRSDAPSPTAAARQALPRARSSAPSPPPTEHRTPPPSETPPSLRTTHRARTTIPQFDPYTVLSVAPDTRGFSCVAHSARDGRQCSNLIPSEDRIRACGVLDRIAARPLSAGRLSGLLQRLGPLVLCRRHQGRSERTVERWRGMVDDMVVEEAVQRGRENASQRGRRPMEDEDEESESTSNDEDSSESTRSESNSDNDDDDPSPSTTSTAATTPSQTPTRARIPPPAPTPPARSPSPRSPPTTRSTVTRRPLDSECSICQEAFEDSQETTWCERQCGQNFHRSCIDEWIGTQTASRGTANCAYW
ncbi:MAG: hypothetical protein M1813_000090 [Trichoglossum hirsutum]|nr:MAG: hypothetical protein M1813_000090 [Trichoglossum hirsutum]